MRYLILLMITTSIYAQTSAPNPTSGSPTGQGNVHDGALAPTGKQKQEVRERVKNMDGAPNAGGGMGTGTGVEQKKLPQPSRSSHEESFDRYHDL